MTTNPLTDQQLDDIEARARDYTQGHTHLTLCGPACAVTKAVPALVAELRLLRAELDAEKSAHRFTLRQRNNRSTRLTHLRDLALAGDTEALLAAAKDTLAASRDDHTDCASPSV